MNYTQQARECVAMMNSIRHLMKMCFFQEEMKGENFLLIFLEKSGGSATPGQISQAMQVTTPRITALLNALEEKGHILRIPSKSDRRRATVAITDLGRQHIRKTQDDVIARTASVLEFIGEEDAEELIRIMNKLSGYVPENGGFREGSARKENEHEREKKELL